MTGRHHLTALILLALIPGAWGCGGGEEPVTEQSQEPEATETVVTDEQAPPTSAELPVYPGAKQLSSTSVSGGPGGGGGEQRLYQTGDSPQEVGAFYEREMVAGGWRKLMAMPTEQGTTTTWVRDEGEGVTVSVGIDQSGTTFIAVTGVAG